MLIGGTAALWFALRAGKGLCGRSCRFWRLANIKDNTFRWRSSPRPLIAADYFLFGFEQQWKKGWGRRLGVSALCMGMPLVLYQVWAKYIARLVQQNAAAGAWGKPARVP